MKKWIRYNANPAQRRVEDCIQRAISAALGVDWRTASDMIHEVAREIYVPEHSDAAWGTLLHRLGFRRAIVPNTCPECYTLLDFCEDHPRGVYVVKTSGHVVTVINGRALDTWNSLGTYPIYYYFRGDRRGR